MFDCSVEVNIENVDIFSIEKLTQGQPLLEKKEICSSMKTTDKEDDQDQSLKKLHAAHTLRVDIFFRIENIWVQKTNTYVAILNFLW